MMKRLFLCWVAVLVCIAPLSAQTQPEKSDTLRILGVGNSFTDDGMMYLPDLLREAGIHNVVVARLYHPGCSLEQHCRFYADDSASYIYYKSTDNEWVTVDPKTTLTRALEDEPWDIVVVQQASPLSGIYDSFFPWLDQLVAIIANHNSNADMELGWQMTWAYSTDSDHDGFFNYGKDQQLMYNGIAMSAERLLEARHFDYLIPSGVAIQNLRAAGVESLRDMTRDGYHLDLGVGRYAAACVWFESLVRPFAGCSVRGDSFRIAAAPETTAVTDATAAACRLAAESACRTPFEEIIR